MENIFNALSVVLLVLILYPKLSIKFNKNVKNVSGSQAVDLIRDNKDLVVIDVRTKNEFKSGHINGAKLMPVSEMKSRISELEKFRGKPILVHCASGGRSPKAVKVLLKNKFGPIYHMNRGLASFSGRLAK
jgi:rhodanese-related sulfurtransferase